MLAIFLLLILQLTQAASSQTEAARLFALGVQLHAQGDVAGAVAAFEGAELTGWDSGMLQYDLGTAYLDLGQNGAAILHFERARRFLPGDDAVNRNLRIARERAGLASDPQSPIGVLRDRALQMGGSTFWLAFGLVFYVGLISLIGRRVWTGNNEAWSRRATTALVPVTLCVLIIAFSAWGSTRVPDGIVLSEGAQLRSSPALESASGAALQPGQVVRILETRGDWQEVKLNGGVRGWLPARSVERI